MSDKYIKRLEFLAENFNVFEFSTDEDLNVRIDNFNSDNQEVKVVRSSLTNKLLALIFNSESVTINKKSGKEYFNLKTKVEVEFDVFHAMVDSDSTENKIHTQWMLNTFTKMLKRGEIWDAVRFFDEDLPLAKKYLQVFETNKKKKLFKELCAGSSILKDIENPSNINQYASLSELYDAVDPFIEKDVSGFEKTLMRYVNSGKANIVFNNRNFMVYVPFKTEANTPFEEFTSWCTARKKNGMFKDYTSNNKRPDGSNSILYIVINKKFFDGDLKDEYLYNVHFETRQVKNRKQNKESNFYRDVISKDKGVSEFFNKELTELAKSMNTLTNKNLYIDYLIDFGWTQILFDMIDDITPIILIENRKVITIPDISKFKELQTLAISNCKTSKLHPSIGELSNLQELLLPNNVIESLPKEIGKLKNLLFINLKGNELKTIPIEISELDETKGGSLYRIAIDRDKISEVNYRKLKKLLPSVKM
jgi:hypothetical protein